MTLRAHKICPVATALEGYATIGNVAEDADALFAWLRDHVTELQSQLDKSLCARTRANRINLYTIRPHLIITDIDKRSRVYD